MTVRNTSLQKVTSFQKLLESYKQSIKHSVGGNQPGDEDGLDVGHQNEDDDSGGHQDD